MRIQLVCACGQSLQFGKAWAGKFARCSGCGAEVSVPPLGLRVAPANSVAKHEQASEPVATDSPASEPESSSFWPRTSLTLLSCLRDGTAMEWQTFVDAYAPLVYRYCRHKGLQDADADLVTWGVMAKAQKFEYDPKRGRFRNWLLTVTQREVNRVRKKGSVQAGQESEGLAEEIAVATADIDWDRLYRAHILQAAMARIESEFDTVKWQAFQAVGFRLVESADGKAWVEVEYPPYPTIAADMGRSVDWLYKVKSEILKRLKEETQYLAEDLGILT